MTYKKFGWVLVASGVLLIGIAVSTLPILRLLIALPTLLGFHGAKTYLMLLQNNTELRPTGGFMGTFALVHIDRGKPKVEVHDIYTPDGQVKGHVDPPAPIQEAFRLGEWRLRDANWDPDFPSSAQTIEWFMEKGGISDINGTIATNLIVFEEVLRVLGPIELPDYKEIVTAENLWLLGEKYAQDSFFPGSIQKQEFFSDLAKQTMGVVSTATLSKKFETFNLGLRMIKEKHVMGYLRDPRAQRVLESLNWAGQLQEPSCPLFRPRCIAESLMIVEANLGVNKANCCVTRSVNLEIEVPGTSNDPIRHKLTLKVTNRSTKELWGGRYKAWVRIYANAREQTGFWIEVPEGENREYTADFSLSYPPNRSKLPNPSSPILLLVQKQSGIAEYPLTIMLKDGEKTETKEIKTIIQRDQVFVL